MVVKNLGLNWFGFKKLEIIQLDLINSIKSKPISPFI